MNSTLIASIIVWSFLVVFEVYRIMRDEVSHQKRMREDIERAYNKMEKLEMRNLKIIDELNRKIRQLEKVV